MGYENDPYMDEDGEPLMDPDSPFGGEASPGRVNPVDDDEEDDWRRDRSPTPVLDEGKGGKPRKRLVKKIGKGSLPDRRGSPPPGFPGEGLDDWEEDEEEHPSSSSKKRKALSMKYEKGGSWKKEKERRKSTVQPDRSAEKSSKSGLKGYGGGSKDHGGDSEMKELWDTFAGGDSEGKARGRCGAADDRQDKLRHNDIMSEAHGHSGIACGRP